jgi:L-arabinose isomerase
MNFNQQEVWFVTGAQLLYGGETVRQVDAQSTAMVDGLNKAKTLPVKVVYKGTVNTAAEIAERFQEANNSAKSIGIITWMHTFSPAKMWIHGLQILQKPILHLHTQFQREIKSLYCSAAAINLLNVPILTRLKQWQKR